MRDIRIIRVVKCGPDVMLYTSCFRRIYQSLPLPYFLFLRQAFPDYGSMYSDHMYVLKSGSDLHWVTAYTPYASLSASARLAGSSRSAFTTSTPLLMRPLKQEVYGEQ